MIENYEVIARLVLALAAGAAIGAERQWRQRTAGLRTNALVALGAAAFTLFGLSAPGEASPTRVAAQVASGIGFLGAGVILREGLNIRGLNTAATLWCSAAVGVFCGAGEAAGAIAVAAMVMMVNLAVRPLVSLIDRQRDSGAEEEHLWRVSLTCSAEREAQIRTLLLQAVSAAGLRLRGLESRESAGEGHAEITAELLGTGRSATPVEQVVGRISLEPSVTRAGWTDVLDVPA
jgi:putative Mg2+ transporter-C (MgtC) family protein